MGRVLSAANKRMLWVPPGFAHGFLVLSEDAEFLYKTTDYWYPEHERTLLWNDPALGIEWPLTAAPVLAAKDAAGRRSPTPTPTRKRTRAHAQTEVLVTGAQGQVGFELARLLAAHADVVAVDRATLDLADPDAIVSAMREARPDIVVNAGAYTAVDAAERERDAAFAGQRARAAGSSPTRRSARTRVLIHYSTDYVFDGAATTPVRRGCADRAAQRLRRRASSRASARSRRAARTRSCCARAGCTGCAAGISC